MMGGSRDHDEDVPVTLVAQRDMVKREIEYYKERCEALTLYTFFTLFFGSIVCFVIWKIYA